jgi:hypothetical protein
LRRLRSELIYNNVYKVSRKIYILLGKPVRALKRTRFLKMAYLLENDTSHITNDIIKRKEFYQFDLPKIPHEHDHINKNIIPRFMVEKMISDGNFLQFHSYQLFVSNYMNPNTPYSRLLMKWQTGTGKTIGALSIALNFIDYLKQEEAQGSSTTGSVFIMGFSAHVFRKELLRFPEFGIITRQELVKLNNLRKLAYDGTKFDVENLQEFLMRIKKKLVNRSDGFFHCIGYKKLVNMIFKINDPEINISNMSEVEIDAAIKTDKIKLNIPVLDGFKNSLVICDEIHNVYNSLEKNNWGVALQYVLNYHSSIRAVFMSATPINNSPVEIVDLLNFLLPKAQYKSLDKSEFFDSEKNLKPGALDKITNLCKGRISYLRDANPKYYPTKKFIGESIHGAPYIKFVRCPMSDFHYETYKVGCTGPLGPESQYLTDFAIPNPNDPKIGLYQTSEIKKLIPHASQKWKDDNKINFQKEKIVGDILQLKNLHKISNKFFQMLETINDIIKHQKGKIFIYHNIIHMSGVLFIQEIMLQNFIIGEYDSSSANTLCVICGKMRKDHSTEQLGGAIDGGGSIDGSSSSIEKTNERISKSLQNIQIGSPKSRAHLILKYNYNTDCYEICIQEHDLLSNLVSCIIMEYKLCCDYDMQGDIITIQSQFINFDDAIALTCLQSKHIEPKNTGRTRSAVISDILRELARNNRVVIMSKTINLDLENIINKLQFYILCSDAFVEGTDGRVYYASANCKISKSAKSNFIRRIDAATATQKRGGRKKHGNAKKSAVVDADQIDPRHTYMPVRFISIHNELGRNSISHSLNKYNSPDNSDGNRILILIGGRLIKEAYDIKAVRELMIMGRPDNIPTMIQILGRAVRNKSHSGLPPHKRNVNIRIFTSCLPTKVRIGGEMVYGLGYNEKKYIEKLKHYKIIQLIEKSLHENAIDAHINQDIIWNPDERHLHRSGKIKNELGPIYFEPNMSGRLKSTGLHKSHTFKLSELNLQTFNAFHTQTEIDNIFMIIKRLFVEKSPVWTYQDLFDMVKSARKYFQVEFNTQLISENLFIVSLSRLVWSRDVNYVEPVINNNASNQNFIQNNVINKLFDTEDKIIVLPNNQKSVITQVGSYYILFPLDEMNNEPMNVMELPYRLIKSNDCVSIDIKSFLEKGNSLTNYADKRDRFVNKWNNVSIEKLELAVCDFGTDFHVLFLEECIKYVFDVWNDPKMKKSFRHAFYFKMLNYYDLRQLVIWGHTLKQHLFKKYEQYITPVSTKIRSSLKTNQFAQPESADAQPESAETSGIINMLKSSINKSDLNWVSSGLKKQFEENLENSLKLFDGNYKKPINSREKTKKVNADLVPVGHFLNHIPKFYHPVDDWYESPEYLESSFVFVENEILIGYDERTKTGIHTRFKIRSPIQNIKQYKDSRMIEKGSVCSCKSKTYLREISEKIGIKFKDKKKINVVELCSEIRTKLIYLELKERIAKTKKKWFYFIYERRPETIVYS